MRYVFVAGVIGLALAAGIGAASAGVSSAQTASQVCTTSGYGGYPTSGYGGYPTSGYSGYYPGTQATCQVTASTQLSPPNTVFVLPVDATAVPVSCQGVSSAGYTTQGTVTAAPPSLYSGQSVCQFTVTSGVAPGGSYLGTETVSVGGAVQLNAYLCGDPSCATGMLNPYAPPAPPSLVTITNGGSVYNPTYSTAVSNPAGYSTYNPGAYNPAWDTTPNRCFHVAGSPDPCQQNSGHHHGDGDDGGDGDGG